MADASSWTVRVTPTPEPTGPGRAFIFVFPFGIERSASEIAPLLARLGDMTCRVWAPYVNRADMNGGEPVDYERIPSPPGADSPGQSIMRLHIRPLIPENADLAIASAMRVDVYGARSEAALADAASATADRLLRLCRLWLRQWWINRGPDDLLGTRRISFGIHPSGMPASQDTESEIVVRPRLRSEARLTSEHFQLIWAAFSLGGDSPLSATALLDSVYFSTFGERERAILDAAIACEALLREAAHERLSGFEARSVVPAQPLGTAVKVTRAVFGRPLDDAQIIAGLERLQTARNALAHGNAQEIRRLPEVSDPGALWQVQRAAFNLFRWAATVVPRTFPDPVMAFERPVEPPLAVQVERV